MNELKVVVMQLIAGEEEEIVTTYKQVTTNRGNAALSTGPRSEAGKARSSQNALKHGLTAQRVVLFDEDPKAFEALRNRLYAHYEPEDPYAEYLVEQIATAMWRLRRVSVVR